MEIEFEENSYHHEQISEYHSGEIEGISILPRFDDGLSEDRILYESDSITIRKLIENSGLEYTPLDVESESPTVAERSDHLVLPSIYVGYKLVNNNWDEIKNALQSIGEYYHRRAVREIDLEVVQETKDGYTNRFSYTGHPDDLEKLPDHMKEVIDDDDE